MNWLLALASGHLLVLLFPQFEITLLAPIALAPLLYALARERDWRLRLALGEVAGFVYWIGTCYWIRGTLVRFGGLDPALAWLALILFALIKALHLAVFSALAGFLLPRWYALPAVAALWCGIERTHGTFGFAWLTLGNAAAEMEVPLRLAPWVGVYGLSFVLLMANLAVAMILLRRPRRDLAWMLALPLLFLLPPVPEKAFGPKRLTALQPNLTEEVPADVSDMVNRSLVAHSRGASLIVWPEAPTGFYWERDAKLRETIATMARLAQAPVLLNAVTFGADGAPRNSAVLVGADGLEAGRYSKTFLVPFGEFVPPLFGWINKVSNEASDFAPGDGPRVFSIAGEATGAFICYEAAFPHLVRQFPALGASVLLNLSNDGWYAGTGAREQHFLLARMRAVENGRWLLRVTNDGITAAIDPAGRVIRRLPEFQNTAGPLPYETIRTKTPYTSYGDWFAWSCLAAGLFAAGGAAIAERRGWTPSAVPSESPGIR